MPNGLSDVYDMDVGYNASCALKIDGTVTCWGTNSSAFASGIGSDLIQIDM